MGQASERRDEARVVGLIAGGGELPASAARLLRSAGQACEIFGFEGVSDPDLSPPANRTRLGQLVRLAEALEAAQIGSLLIVGHFSKALLLGGSALLSPDAEALRLLARDGGWDDDGLQAAIADWLAGRGFEIERQDERLGPLLAGPGGLSRRAPSPAERADFERGRAVVASLGRSGAGQCAAVRRGCVLALEAAEGTDAMILRAGRLGGPGATIVKAARPGQDRRFDLPTVGPGTIDAMREAGATALALEAGSTLVVDRERFVERADEAGLAVWGFEALESAEAAGR